MREETSGQRPQGRPQFSETHWSLVLAAANRASPGHLPALETLCAHYWYPLYAYVRRRGYGVEDAKDLTQAFFTRVIEKDYLRTVDGNKGRFRSFLLGAMNHFLANEWDRQMSRKRGGGRSFVSIQTEEAEGRYQHEPKDDSSPEKIFERRWVLTILGQALERLRREHAKAGKTGQFDILKEFLDTTAASTSHAEAAKRLGTTAGNVAVKVNRMRKRYRELVEWEIAQTVSNPQEIEKEKEHLLACISQ